MQKVYERIVWADFPSTKTALASRLLNQMDYAIDEIDNRVVELSGYQEEALLSEQNSKESEIKAKISETNAKESEVKSKEYMEKAFAGTPEGYEQLVDKVNFPIVTTTEFTLPNSAAGGLRVNRILGNSYQKVVVPKNMLNLNGGFTEEITEYTMGSFNMKLKFVADANLRLSHINVSGYAGGGYAKIASYTTTDNVILNGCPSGGSADTYWLCFRDNTTGETYYDYGEGVFIPSGLEGEILFGGKAGTELDLILYPMISKEGGAYEPYGIPTTPSPESKSEIQHFGDCVDMVQGWYGTSGTFESSNNHVCTKNFIPCVEGDVIELTPTNSVMKYLYFYNNGSFVRLDYKAASTESEKFNAPSGVTHFKYAFDSLDGLTLDTVGKITLTVNGKYGVVIRTKNKNLLNVPETITRSEKGYYFKKIPLPLKANTPYVISFTPSVGGNNGCQFTFIDVDGNNVSDKVFHLKANTKSTRVITFEKDIISATLYVNTSENTISECQIELGEVATDFVPAKETQTIVWLEKPLMQGDELCKKDGKWYIKRNRSSAVLNSAIGFWHENGLFVAPKIATPNMKFKANILCDAYMATKETTMPDLSCCAFKGDGYRVWFKDTRFGEDAHAFKEYLDTIGGVYVEYELAESVFEELSVYNQIALNSIETFADTTHIIVDSYIPTSGMTSEYGVSKIGAYTLKTLLNSESNAIRLEELATALVAVGSEV